MIKAIDEGALSIDELLRALMPDGTNPIRRLDTWALGMPAEPVEWERCPSWPPDSFAAAATLAERSGCYAELGIVLSGSEADRARKGKDATSAERTGVRWSKDGNPPRLVLQAWETIRACKDELVCSPPGKGQRWKRAVMRLLAYSDEACNGAGTTPDGNSSELVGFIADQFVEVFSGSNSKSDESFLHYLPNSIARAIPPSRACVLPKGRTPALGCTLRSVTHHLALLPGTGHVTAEWRLSATTSRAPTEPFNILIVPYPYVLGGSDIRLQRAPDRRGMDGYFSVQPRKLDAADNDTGLPAFIRFLSALIVRAETGGGSVGGLVLPEGALYKSDAVDIVDNLIVLHPRLELFISGTIQPLPTVSGDFAFDRNEAYVARMSGGRVVDRYSQAKHHRWRLDAAQIRGYTLGHLLDPAENWWEAIDVSQRRIVFGVDNRGGVISALICEDLARYDPVLPVLAAVGPNLVVALLMDGPQLERRWSGRYATALAEDPGSAVLSVTSRGMVRRSIPPNGVKARDCIALWKDREGQPHELDLGDGDYALLLALSVGNGIHRTLDLRGRLDGGLEYRLGGVRSVQLTELERKQFAWLDVPTKAT